MVADFFLRLRFERLEVDITLTSALQIGDFITSFSYAQSGVPAHTDSSLVVRQLLFEDRSHVC